MNATAASRSRASLVVERVDYADPAQGDALFRLLDGYARDPAGGGEPLDPAKKGRLLAGLAATPNAFSLLAYLDGQAVGLANCFTGFSTFAMKPVVNLHDLAVDPDFRGRGIGRALFAAVESEARSLGAAKVTLEVLSGNERAKGLYRSLGYGDYVLDPHMGQALFWQKVL
ncbi:MAG: GNAT family N-acetyltransferase [Sphingobium sp.]|nr:GNAT family N-acetyltransferase [Sphingobium sp.]